MALCRMQNNLGPNRLRLIQDDDWLDFNVTTAVLTGRLVVEVDANGIIYLDADDLDVLIESLKTQRDAIRKQEGD